MNKMNKMNKIHKNYQEAKEKFDNTVKALFTEVIENKLWHKPDELRQYSGKTLDEIAVVISDSPRRDPHVEVWGEEGNTWLGITDDGYLRRMIVHDIDEYDAYDDEVFRCPEDEYYYDDDDEETEETDDDDEIDEESDSEETDENDCDYCNDRDDCKDDEQKTYCNSDEDIYFYGFVWLVVNKHQ